MRVTRQGGRRAALYASISLISLAFMASPGRAQTTDIGKIGAEGVDGAPAVIPPIASDAAVGSKAPAGSAPALAPSQGSLNAFQPGSVVSDKIIKDVVPPTGDYNEAAKFTPSFYSNNTNGLLGDAKSGWRGFQDGQFNVTFDDVPFGDANDPTHHSAAYFPRVFLGGVTVDRGPGAASQLGYATFGGTLALRSIDLTDTFSGNLQGGLGQFRTSNASTTINTGLMGNSGVRALFQYSNSQTAGAIDFGKVHQQQVLAKIEKQFENVRVTVFGTYGREDYNNIVAITYPQLQQYGKNYGAVNANPRSQQYVGYNNSQKRTDLEYIGIDGAWGDWHVMNKVYTYAYDYPSLQNNGANQTIEGNSTIANGGSITSVSIPTISGGKIKVNVIGVANGDTVGYIKNNNYRAYGDTFKVARGIDAGIASGTIRTGVWAEHVDNSRLQEYINYTTGLTFSQLGNSKPVSYKLDLESHITTVQPFIEYDWQPIDRLTITPGYKFESFTRDHSAAVNQTTLQPINYSATYTASLPFLAARYRLTPEATIYAQASKGFLAPTVSAFYVFNPQNDNIKPQTTTNYQAGIVYKTGRITADADIYQVTAKNFPLTNTLPTGETIYTNAGTAVYRGLEAEASYSIVNGLSAYASGALIAAKYTKGPFEGLRVGDAPNFTAAGGAIYDDGMVFGSLLQKFVGSGYGSSGEKYATTTTNSTLNKIPGYSTTDLVVGIRSNGLYDLGVGRSAQLKLGVYNVLNHRSTVAVAGDPTGLTSVNNTTLTYAFLPGRTVFATLGVDF